MPIHFFDSCALQHRYFPSPYSRRVKTLVSRETSECFISEWSILEMSSTIANRVRQANASIGDIDKKKSLKDFDRRNDEFLKDVASGRLQVVSVTQRHYVKARDLIRYAGVAKKRSLKSGDALVATCGLALARQRKEKVFFYTSDGKLYDILRKIDSFESGLEIVLLGTPRA